MGGLEEEVSVEAVGKLVDNTEIYTQTQTHAPVVGGGCVRACGGGGVGVADHRSAKLETMCRQELKANIYRALICMGSSEFPAWVSASTAGPRNTEGHGW